MINAEAEKRLDVLMDKVCEELDVDGATYFEVHPETEEMTFRIVKGEKSSRIRELQSELKIKVGQGVCGHVAKTGQAMLVNDPESTPQFNQKVDLLTGYWTMSLLAVPVMVGPEVAGVIEVLNKRVKYFAKQDQAKLEELAREAATIVSGRR